jgi:hypothetical protein
MEVKFEIIQAICLQGLGKSTNNCWSVSAIQPKKEHTTATVTLKPNCTPEDGLSG